MARVERDGHLVDPAFFADGIEQSRSCRAIAVIGNQKSVRSAGIFARGQYKLTPKMRIGALGGLAVQTNDLLSRGMGESGKDPRFGHRAVALVLEHSANGNAAVAEGTEQEPARFIVTYYTDRKNSYAQVGKVANRVGGAARNYFAIPVLQDQHRRFARDARDFAEDEFIGDQITQDGDGGLGKRLHDLAQAVVLSDCLGHDGI